MKAKTVIFFCNWSSYPGLQMSRLSDGMQEKESDEKMLVSMCSGRISPELIVESFKQGAWGVMVAACPPESCEHDGNYRTYGRISLLKNMLKQLGMDSQRLRLEWVDKGEAAKLKQVVDGFVGEIVKMGPVSIPELA
jgi:F420-non-reducing hydrogenase iron-sulfur subunit